MEGFLFENVEQDLSTEFTIEDDKSIKEIGMYDSQNNPFFLPNNEYTMMAIEVGFYEKIATNPIDANWRWDELRDGTFIARIEFANEYRDAWKMQIEHTMTILKQNLTEMDFAMLEDAYEKWKLYLENTMDVEMSIFCVGGNYGVGDGITYPMVMESTAMRMKYYAIDLLALEYALTGDMEFILVK